MKIPGFSTLAKLNPLHLLEAPVHLFLQNILGKAFSSLAKGLIAAVVVGLGNALLAFTQSGPDSGDKVAFAAYGFLATGLTAVVHAIISGLKRVQEFDPSKLVPKEG